MQKIFQTINHSLLNMLNYTSPKDISIQKLKKQELTTSNSSHSKSKLNFPSNFTDKKKIKKKNSQHHISEILNNYFFFYLIFNTHVKYQNHDVKDAKKSQTQEYFPGISGTL